MYDRSIKATPRAYGPRLLNPVVTILDALGLCDERNVMLARFLAVTGVASDLAIIERWLTAKPVRYYVVVMEAANP